VWFDSRCHLHLCEQAPVERLVSEARDNGVERLVTIGIDASSSRAARDIASAYGLFFSAGVHPNQAEEWAESAHAIEGLMADPRCVAVGETGLDFYRMGAPRAVQEQAFRGQIDLAKEHDKALVIHTRDSLGAALDVIETVGPPNRLVFHCWSGTAAEVDRAARTGAFISFAGNVSFASAGSLRDSARVVPRDRLLVETDSPFLAPVPRRGKPNDPSNVPLVGGAVAEARGEAMEEIAAATSANATRLFGV
jgi:TatD DNase family protein